MKTFKTALISIQKPDQVDRFIDLSFFPGRPSRQALYIGLALEANEGA